MKRASLGILAIMLALAACKEPRTEIVVTVDSNLTIPDELDQVRIVVTGETSSQRFDQTYDLGPTKTKLPIVLGLVPDSDEKLAFRVVATGLSNSVAVVERAATTSFVPDQTLALYLDLLRVCMRATCQSGETCGPQGICTPESIKPADLPKYGTAHDAGAGAIQGDGGLTSDAIVADAGDGAGFVLDSGITTDHPVDDMGLEEADAALPASDTSPAIKLDVQPATPDTAPAIPDTAQDVPDTSPPPDTAPACPTVTVQPPPAGSPEGTRWAAMVQATSTNGFCFKTCDSPIFGLTWKNFSGRTLTVNGTLVYLVGVDGKINSDTGTTESPPTTIAATGLRTFQVSAGSSASAAFTWYGSSVVCPASGPDASPAIPDVAPVPADASPVNDTAPAIPCDKFGPFASTGSALPIPLPTTAYCFKLCPNAFPPLDPLGFTFACMGFTDADRTITINGQAISCVDTHGAGSVAYLPEVVDGAWTFVLSAGGHSGDFIAWGGELRACP